MYPDFLRQGSTLRGDQDELDALVRGHGCFTNDLVVPAQCFAAFVRSPLAHARVLSIQTQEALKQPGVRGIYTGADLARDGLGGIDRKSTRLNSSHTDISRMPSSA